MQFTNAVYAALGNHECTGATDSNCGTGNADGITKNYTAFMTKFLEPQGYTKPYYVVNLTAQDGTWTAKLVFIAANAWDSTQSAWLTTTLAQPTTYTFVVATKIKHGKHGARRHAVGDDRQRAPVHAQDRRPHAHLQSLRVRARGDLRQRRCAAGRVNYGYAIVRSCQSPARSCSSPSTTTRLHAVLDEFKVNADRPPS